MGRITKFLKENYPFLLILLTAVFLRVYRLDTLTTFGGDQGQDFLTVRDMILFHKWTLIGLKTSMYAFFQGPVYLYMLLPFFYILKLAPVSGAVSAVFYSSLSLIVLYITVKKFFPVRAALISSALFAVSPELIVYGNTPLYQHFLPIFIFLTFYFFLLPKRSLWTDLILGLSLGIGIETHLLDISLTAAVILFYVIFERKWKTIFRTILGTILGLSPTILFELRHNFLNTRYLLSYHPASGQTLNLSAVFTNWEQGAGIFLGANSVIIGALILIFILIALFIKGRFSPAQTRFHRLAGILALIILLFSFTFSAFGSYYILPLWLALLIILPQVILRIFPKKLGLFICILLILVNFVASAKQLNANHGYTMPSGWSLNKIEKTAEVIKEDAKTHDNFNVSSLLDAEARAYALRYTLLVDGTTPQSFENYPSSNYLYVVARNIEEIKAARIYEIFSLAPFTIGKTWDMGDGVFLYRLDRDSWLKILKSRGLKTQN